MAWQSDRPPDCRMLVQIVRRTVPFQNPAFTDQLRPDLSGLLFHPASDMCIYLHNSVYVNYGYTIVMRCANRCRLAALPPQWQNIRSAPQNGQEAI